MSEDRLTDTIKPTVELIRRKRDGQALSQAELQHLLREFELGHVLDCQMSAFAMATCIRGMTAEETYCLTKAMLESGKTIEWDSSTSVVDKHSTGGVGDKASLLIAPLLASFGVRVPMISGRGLGITCLLYTSPSPRDRTRSRMPSSA